MNGIVFDCDGVLVDILESFNETITGTVSYITDSLGYEGMPSANGRLIQAFKDTGGFNNEVDLTYGIIISMIAARRAGRDPMTVAIEAAGSSDMKAAEKFAASIHDISDVADHLAYPGRDSVVQCIFDEIFYGTELYRAITGQPAQLDVPGLIEQERVLMDSETAMWLQEKFGPRMALVTGRGYESARRTLGDMMDMFNLEASSFLEDEPRYLAKPDPRPLERAIAEMGLDGCVYVGDSAEDMIMSRRVWQPVTFVGIYGTAPDPMARRRLFEAAGIKHIIESITDLCTISLD